MLYAIEQLNPCAEVIMYKPKTHSTGYADPVRPHSIPPGVTRTLILAAAVSLLAACASNQFKADGNMAVAASSIETARAAGADQHAAVEINNARTKLERARVLAQSGKETEAQRLAEEAEVDAKVANSKAAAERSARSLAEIEASLGALRQETARPRP